MGVLRQFVNNQAPSKIVAKTKDIAEYAVEKATEFSPFDTGCFMASWRIGKNEEVGGPAAPGRRSSEYEAASEAVSSSMPVIASLRFGQNFYLGNNVSYADFVEYGGPNNYPHYITRRVAQSIGAVYGRIKIEPGSAR